MVLACHLWSDSAWEAPQVSASLMAIEQAVLAFQMVQVHSVALASLTVWTEVALASLTVE